MSDKANVMAALNQWMTSLDEGDLEGMIATCDPEAVVANENQPTTIGIQAIRDKYGPKIEAMNIRSGYDIEHFAIYGDFALIVGHFDTEVTDKISGEAMTMKGRLILSYRRHDNGEWKMILDVDNNA